MNVAQLIQILKEYPLDTDIFIRTVESNGDSEDIITFPLESSDLLKINNKLYIDVDGG